jgi:two-component system, sensor histidine kinase PdtaS
VAAARTIKLSRRDYATGTAFARQAGAVAQRPARTRDLDAGGARAAASAVRPLEDRLNVERRQPPTADEAPVMIWRAGAGRSVDYVNQAWLDFTGRSQGQELGFGWTARVHPEDLARCISLYAEAFAGRREVSAEYRLLRRDGTWRWMLDRGRPCFEGGVFVGFVGSCTDITDMKLALEERRRSAAEQDHLLAELNHRVKNNAQATASFLTLQANRAADPAVSMALRSAATRVMLSTLIQDRMFRAGSEAAIDLGEELEAVARSALEITGRAGLVLEVSREGRFVLPVTRATLLALIVNELVVNAAIHAFPNGEDGHVRLAVRGSDRGLAEVVVADDGVGLPEMPDRPSAEGRLGLHLVPRLAKQAHAALRLDSDRGTRATLRFAVA